MHLEVNVNWDDGEPEELALYFFRKLEAGQYLQRFVDVEGTQATYPPDRISAATVEIFSTRMIQYGSHEITRAIGHFTRVSCD